MTDLLRRTMAPITDEAWQEIDETAARIIKNNLSARTLVDLDGPHGWKMAAVNSGRIDLSKGKKGDVPWATRLVQPLVEVRIPFVLSQQELDNISRGCADADLEAVEDAGRKLAHFEENAIYHGLDEACIKGLIGATGNKPVKLGSDFPTAVGEALHAIKSRGINGPYALVLGTEPYQALIESAKSGYPPYRIVRDMLRGEILWSPVLKGGLVLSTRGGDFSLTVGQDISIGYCSHDRGNVELYLTESFTFRTLEPNAAVELKAKA